MPSYSNQSEKNGVAKATPLICIASPLKFAVAMTNATLGSCAHRSTIVLEIWKSGPRNKILRTFFA